MSVGQAAEARSDIGRKERHGGEAVGAYIGDFAELWRRSPQHRQAAKNMSISSGTHQGDSGVGSEGCPSKAID